MWTIKLKLNHKDCPIVTRCVKFKVIVLSYPSISYEKKGKKFATTICRFQSEDEEAKKRFIEDLKADKRIVNLEVYGEVFIYEINLGKEGEHVMLYHNKELFFIKPTINHYDGHEYWEVASWKRALLEKFSKELEKHMDIFSILKLEESPLKEIYFPSVMPQLSKKQKKALETAYSNGYYSYPRKITLKRLAKIAGVGISTFQEHLRKAELKILPILIEQQIT